MRTFPCERAEGRISPPATRKEALFSLLLSLFLLLSSLSPALAGDWYVLESWEAGVRTLGAPQLLYPPHASLLPTPTPRLDWSDVEGATSYQLLVDNDPNFTSPEINVFPVPSEYTVPSPGLSDGTWYWKVRAKAGALSSPWSETRSFTVDTVFPPSPSPLFPENGKTLLEDRPLFTWTAVWDSSGVSYILEIDDDPDFGSPLYRKTGLVENWHELENGLCENFSPYYWRVCAVDGAGNENRSQPFTFILKLFPSSRVKPLLPYWQTSSPITVEVEAWDNDGYVENVELWYRYSPDNSTWSSWLLYDNLSAPPYAFLFLPPNGEGYYQFHSRAWDDRGNYEEAPPEAEVEMGYDNTPPASPSPFLPGNGAIVETPTPTLEWSKVWDVSGVVYELEVCSVEGEPLYCLQTTENVHTLENALESGDYCWRVRAKDGAGWMSGWSENYLFTVRLWRELDGWWTAGHGLGRWQELEGWTGTTVAPHVWKELERWGGSLSTVVGWRRMEGWELLLSTLPCTWYPLEGYTASSFAPARWRWLEGFTCGGEAPASWREGESWRADLKGTTGTWREAETWTAFLLARLGEWSPLASWSCLPSSPVPPPLPLSPPRGYNTRILPLLGWENLQPADNFELQVDNEPTFSPPVIYWKTGLTSTSHALENALPDNLYYWRVRQWRTGSCSDWSEVWTFRMDTVPPSRPLLLSPLPGENVGDNTPLLVWQAPPENSLPLMYYVQVSTSRYFEWWEVVREGWVSSPSWEVSPSLPDGLYYWRVLARDNAGNTGLFTEARVFRIDTLPPQIPEAVQPENGGWTTSLPTFTWQPVQENSLPVLYRFFLAYDEGFNLKVEDLWTTSTSLSLSLPEGTYWWKVGARDNAGNWSGWSGGRWFRVDNTPPSRVVLLRPENGVCVDQRVELGWENAADEGAGVKWYEVEVDTDSAFSSPVWKENSSENCSSPVLPPGEYCWRVRAWDSPGNAGSWSEVRWFRLCAWKELERWTAGAEGLPKWSALEGWTLFPSAGVCWRGLESWSSRVSAVVSWASLESWGSLLETSAWWRSLEQRGSGLQTLQEWKKLEGWEGRTEAISSWRKLEGWQGQLFSPPGWWSVETWNVGMTPRVEWKALEGWQLQSSVLSLWRALEGWTGLVGTSMVWRYLEGWTVGFSLPSGWRLLERWEIASRAPASWIFLDSGQGGMKAPSSWSSLEGWTSMVSAPASWREMEGWTVKPVTMVGWNFLESRWAGVSGPAAWMVLEGWGAEMGTPARWVEVEGWRAGMGAPSRWKELEGWSVGMGGEARWYPLEERGAGMGAGACWRKVEEWMGSLSSQPSVWRTIESWSSTVFSPPLWRVLDALEAQCVPRVSWSPLASWSCLPSSPVPPPLPLSPPRGYNTRILPLLGWENLQPADNFELQADNEPTFSPPVIYWKTGLTSTSHALENGLSDGLYYWRVRQWRTGSCSDWSEVWTFRMDTVPPSRPLLLSPLPGENVGDNTPLLVWQAPPENSLPLMYYVEVSPDKVNIVENVWVTSTSHETSFKTDGNWWWRVLARDNAGNTGLFTEWRRFRVDTLPPSPPILLSPENDRWVQTSPVLSWRAVEENSLPVFYNVVVFYYPSLLVRENAWTSSTSFVTILDEGKYLWRVRARDNAGNVGNWSEDRLFGVDNTPPSRVGLLSPSTGEFLDFGPVRLRWTPSIDEPSGVRCYRLQVGGPDLFPLLYENEVEENGYTWMPPGAGSYSWRVKAIDLAGNEGEWSEVGWFRVCEWVRLEEWTASGSSPAEWRRLEEGKGWLASPSRWWGLEGWEVGTRAPFLGWRMLEGWSGGVGTVMATWRGLEEWRIFSPAAVPAPLLLFPENGRNMRENAPTLGWRAIPLADNYRLQLSSQPPEWRRENAWVGSEPLQLVDGSSRRGEVVGGSFEETRWEDGVCENIAEDEDNILNWEHRLENVPWATFYVVRIRGRTSGDENVGVYLWRVDGWRLLGLLGGEERTLEFSFGSRELPRYLVEGAIHVRYSENSPDDIRTVLYVDLCVVEGWYQEFPSTLVDSAVTENRYTPFPLPDNLYYWRVRASVAGLVGEWSEVWTFRVDTLPPQAPPLLLYPADGENLNTSTPLLAWSSPPENSHPLAFFVQLALDHLFTQQVENSGWIQQNYWVPSPLGENVYYWRVFVRDNAGNECPFPSPTRSFRVDLTPPSPPVLLSPAHGENLKAEPLLRWGRVWDVSLPISYNVRVEYGPVTVYDVTVSENAWQVPPLFVDGIYTWKVRTRDGAGNWSSFTPPRTFQLDRVPPPVPSPLSPENGENLREVEFRWTPVGENSLPVRYRVILSDDPSFPHENGSSGWLEGENWKMDLNLPDGIWYWRVQARDNAGNVGENSEVRWFMLDTKPPEGVVLLWPENGAILEGSQPILTWTEGTDPSLPLRYRVLISRKGAVENYLDSGWRYENWWEVPFPLPDNDYEWRVLAMDNAGNSFEAPVWWFRVENTPPPAPSPLFPENRKVVGIPSPLLIWRPSWDISQPVLHRVWVATDENFENVVADSGWRENDRWEVWPPLQDNLTYYWRVQARDNSGKESENSPTFSFFTDLHAPLGVELLSPPNGAEVEAFTLMFKWRSALDNTSILYEFTIDNEPGMSWPFVYAENTRENSRIVGFSLPGTYYWRVKAKDEAGHENSTETWSFTIRKWWCLEGWSVGLSGPREKGWVLLDGCTVSSRTVPALWRKVEEWSVTVRGGVGWRKLEERRVEMGHRASWRVLEGRNLSMRAPPLRGWVQLENRSGKVVAPHGWKALDRWEREATTVVGWKWVIVGGPPFALQWVPLEVWKVGVEAWAPPPPGEVQFGYLEAGISRAVELGWLGTCLSWLEIGVRESGKVTVLVWEVTDFPLGPPPGLIPYRYFHLEPDVSSPSLSHAAVRVRVSRRWIKEERIDVRTIGVKRVPSLQELTLEAAGRDGQYLYFQFRTEELGTFLLYGQRMKPAPSPPISLLPTFEVPVTPSSTLLLLIFLGMLLAMVGFSLYQVSWSFRYGRMVSLLKKATGRPERRKVLKERVRLTKRQRENLARLSLLLRRAGMPKVVPVRRRLAKPEKVAVEALERFIRERRRKAGITQLEMEKIRKRARKELASWEVLEEVVKRKRREVLRKRVKGSSGARKGKRRAP